MKKSFILIAIVILYMSPIFAQQGINSSTNSNRTKTKLDTIYKNPISLQIHAGTQGVGIDLRYGIIPKFSARLGGSIIPTIKADNALTISGFDADNRLKANLINVHLLGDYAPFKTNSFRVVGGVAYLFKAGGNLKFTPRGGYDFDGLSLTSEEVGNLDIGLSWKGLAPYLGLGFFKDFPRQKFNINIDFGTYYLTAPKSTVVGTNLLSDNDALEPQLDENMKNYRFLPVIQVNFNFRLK